MTEGIVLSTLDLMTEGIVLPTSAPTPAPAPKRGFWGNVGVFFGHAAVYAAKGALWASQHPEVIALVEGAAHVPPGTAATVGKVITVAGAVEQAREAAASK
jgi:hypothetical protein